MEGNQHPHRHGDSVRWEEIRERRGSIEQTGNYDCWNTHQLHTETCNLPNKESRLYMLNKHACHISHTQTSTHSAICVNRKEYPLFPRTVSSLLLHLCLPCNRPIITLSFPFFSPLIFIMRQWFALLIGLWSSINLIAAISSVNSSSGLSPVVLYQTKEEKEDDRPFCSWHDVKTLWILGMSLTAYCCWLVVLSILLQRQIWLWWGWAEKDLEWKFCKIISVM